VVNELGERQVLSFLVDLTLLLIASRFLGEVMKRLGQATVVGELLAGVLLGPSLLGRVAPGLWHFIFPPSPAVHQLLQAIVWLGGILLLLQVGLEGDLEVLGEVGRPALVVSLCGSGVPFLSGLALGWLLPDRYLVFSDKRLIFSLFLAVALAISAIPVIAKVLADLNLIQRKLGMVILGGGTISDFLGWLVLSVVSGLASHASVDLKALFLTIVATALFLMFCYFVGYRLVARTLRWVSDRATIEHSTLTTILAIGLLCAVVTQALGLHAVFGAFVGGLMMSASPRVRKADRAQLRAVASGFLSPIFFAYSGFTTDLLAIHSVAILAVIFGIACLSKLVGCTVGGLAAGLKLRESLAVAVGMNALGGMGVIVAHVGLRLGVLTPEMYAVLIVLALGTSLMSPPLLNWVLQGIELLPEEIERQERERFLSRLPFSNVGAKLLALAGGGPNAELAVKLAAASSNHHEASLTIFHAFEANSTSGRPALSEERLAQLKLLAETIGAPTVYSRSVPVSKDGLIDAVLQESQRGYSAVFAGASEIHGHGSLGGAMLRELMNGVTVPMIITRSVETGETVRRILVPVTGTSYSRLAMTLAILCANAMKSHITALYVAEAPWYFLIGRSHRRDAQPGNAVLEEAKQLGAHFRTPVETLLVEGKDPDSVILRFVNNGDFDMLFLGAPHRSVEEGIYLGPKIERILSRAKCSVAVVVVPDRTE